ncbi:MAG: methyltransferase [Nitrolancea sp.]
MTAQPILQNGNRSPDGSALDSMHESPLHGWRFRCPTCGSALVPDGADRLSCEEQGHLFERRDGIWHCLWSDRVDHFRQFMQEYETVRKQEGRSSPNSAYYHSLPFEDLTGRFRADWRIRATTYRTFVDRVISPLEIKLRRPLRVLDLGAGNCWLSNRLAERGHSVAAIDLMTNDSDGLGAHRHYATSFIPIQAEFDRLPLGSLQADIAIFNGSFHYSTDFEETLREALRVLRADGEVVILDSPIYRDTSSGAAMVAERESQFAARFGFPSNALPMENYLLFERLEQLSLTLGIRWDLHEPFYGLRWSLRPWLARLTGHREPARFMLIRGRQDGRSLTVPRSGYWRLTRRWLQFTQRWRSRSLTRATLEEIGGHPIVILPHVFNPKLFRSGELFASQLNQKLIPPGCRVLDLGTGTGVGAITSARWAREVVAVDLNPIAVRCATANTIINGVDDRVSVLHSDLFDAVKNEQFDRILFNPPFYRGTPRTLADLAWRSEDVIERFAGEVRQHLNDAGCALVILSTDGEEGRFLNEFADNGLVARPLVRRDLGNEVFTIYQLSDAARERHDHPV